MDLPATDLDGNYLVYHRMTGLGGSTAADVVALRDEGCVLEPWSERKGEGEDDPAMHGLQPIDIAAGDGDAVFMTPFAPVATGAWGWLPGSDPPGVAFRLGDLLELHTVTVRPIDFQNFYMSFVTRPPIGVSYTRMEREVDFPPDRVRFMDPLEPSFEIFRRAESYDAFEALDRLYRRTGGRQRGVPHDDDLPEHDLEAAIQGAVEFIYEWEFHQGEDGPSETEAADITEYLRDSIIDEYAEAIRSWERASQSSTEVLVWGPVPLSAAVLAFDARDVIELDPFDDEDELLGLPASKAGNVG